MREWLRETHGAQFELFRHFLGRMFDSEIVASPEQTRAAVIAAFALLLPWFQVLYSPLKSKYAHLAALPSPVPYRDALRADELWLITLTMSVIGLLTILRWQSLFPDLRDYRTLGTLPLRMREIFAGKLTALLAVAAAALLTVNWLPGVAFPMVSHTHWSFRPVLQNVRAYGMASAAGGAFLFFALLALQGGLLNILPPRTFRRFGPRLQGLLAGTMLGLIVLSFSIEARISNVLLQPQVSRWLPPVWFLGFCQAHSGDPDPAMRALSHRAVIGLLAAIAMALATYAVSYRRHRTLLLEGAPMPARAGRSMLLPRLFHDPRQQGVIAFVLQTMGRSHTHRVLLTAYAALAFALCLSGFWGMHALVPPDRVVIGDFLYFHLTATLFTLAAARHLFSIPTELKANWVFRLTEFESEGQWLPAIDRLTFCWIALLWLVPLPLELAWLGRQGIAETVLTWSLAVTSYECLFQSWSKLPFTCSYLPGKTPGWMLALRFFAVIALAPLLQAALLAALLHPVSYAIVLTAILLALGSIHSLRRQTRAHLRLRFDEAPEPEVQSLHLLH
jgi:hypothetical protein